MNSTQTEIANLLRETGEAHHQAFIETDGADPEWPIWYAEYLKDRLGQLFEREITKSELIYLFVLADREHRAGASEQPWPEYYARILASEFTR